MENTNQDESNIKMLTDQQKKLRMSGIGASECSTIFNLNEYSTVYQLWLLKTGATQPEQENDDMWWGSELEPVVRRRYEKETGKTVGYDPETKFCDLSPYMLCHLDGIIPEEKKLLEIKTARYNPSHWGQAGTSEVPPQYTIQCQHQLACMPGYESVDLCVFFWQTKSIVIYHIQRNEEIISKIISGVNDFWRNYVLTNISPDLYTIADVKLAYPMDNQTFAHATPVELSSYEKLIDIREKIKKLEKEELSYKTDLIIMTGANSGIKNNGDLLCTYKANKNGVRSFKVYGEN
jgi:putative phage-type endonuclease